MVLISLDAALADDALDGPERPPRLLSSTTPGADSSSAALHAGARAPGTSPAAAAPAAMSPPKKRGSLVEMLVAGGLSEAEERVQRAGARLW